MSATFHPRRRPFAGALTGAAAALLLALGGACSDDTEFARVDADAELAAAQGPLGDVDLAADAARRAAEDAGASTREVVALDDELGGEGGAPEEQLVVRVVGVDGVPVLAAEVWLYEPREAESEIVLFEMGAGLGAEAFLTARGSRERSDADGLVRTAVFERRGVIGARVGEAWGTTTVNEGQTEATIVLAPDERLLVRVVDPEGAPLPGIPVGLHHVSRNRIRDTRTVETDADGLAELLNPRDFFELAWRDAEFFVSPVVPMADPPTERIDPDALPTEPIELVLGGTCSLRVDLVEENGDPFTGRGTLSATARESRWYVSYEVRLDGTSSAVIPHLEPGLPIRLEFQREGSRADYDLDTVTPPLPDIEGEERFVLSATHPVLVALLTDETGEPLADQRIVYSAGQAIGEVEQDRRRRGRDRETGERSVTTDARGVMRVDLPDSWEGGTANYECDVRTVVRGDGDPASVDGTEPVRSATFAIPAPLVGGPNDIGQVILSPPPLLAAGRVIDNLGAPIEDARVSIYLETVDDQGRARWNRVDDLDTRTDELGAFRIDAWAPVGALGIRAVSGDHVRAEVVPLRAGASDVVLELLGAGDIAGSVDAPDGVDLRRATLLAIPGSPRLDDLQQLVRSADDRTRAQRGSGDFRLDRLLPGVYTVCLTYEGLPGVLFVQDGIQVVAGETARPTALDPIDLNGILRVFELRLRMPDGDPVPWARLRWRAAGSERWADADVGRSGSTTIVADAAIIDVHAITRGVAPTLFEGVSTSRDLVFEPPLEVRVQVDADLLPDPERYTLTVQLVPLSWEGARTSARLGANGAGRFASAGPGPHRIVFSVSVADRRGGSSTFTANPAEEVDLDPFAGEIVLRPRVPQQRLERALERLR